MSMWKKSAVAESQLDELESHLAGTLRPVAPPRELTRRLRDRIRIPARAELARRVASWPFWFIIAGSVVSVALLILTIGRALFHFFERRNI